MAIIEAFMEKPCANCMKMFVPNSSSHKFCSVECKKVGANLRMARKLQRAKEERKRAQNEEGFEETDFINLELDEKRWKLVYDPEELINPGAKFDLVEITKRQKITSSVWDCWSPGTVFEEIKTSRQWVVRKNEAEEYGRLFRYNPNVL